MYRFLLHRLRALEKRVPRKTLGLRGGTARRLVKIV
jgi:hypothetical protein